MILILTFVFVINNQSTSAEDLLADVPQEELIAYLAQLELDEYDLVSAFPDESEIIEFEDVNMLDGLEMEEDSWDTILEEYNLDDEILDI